MEATIRKILLKRIINALFDVTLTSAFGSALSSLNAEYASEIFGSMNIGEFLTI
jgi:hypothetical protein